MTQRTTTVPVMPACNVQSYPKVPAVLKVRATCAFDVTSMLAGAPVALPKITLCARAPKLHVTTAPRTTSTVAGAKSLEFVPAATEAETPGAGVGAGVGVGAGAGAGVGTE